MKSNPRRILIFSLVYYPRTIGGAEVAVKEITDRIDSSEVEFDMITSKLVPGAVTLEKVGNITVHRIGFGSLLDKLIFPILGTIKALRLMTKNEYDLFWAMMVTYSSGVPYIVNILRKIVGRTKVPVMLTLQEGDSEEYIKGKSFGVAGMLWRIVMSPFILVMPRKFRKLGLIGVSWALALKRTDQLTVISKYLESQAREYGYTGPISVIPNGVDANIFSVKISDREARELKDKLGKKEGDILLVTTSRLVPKNGIADVIAALEHLPANVKFLIIGSGQLEESLKLQVASDKLEGRVIFTGFMQHTEMAKYVQISDIFIRPSLSEGLGNSFLEAMAAEIPVIATPVGGIPDFLVEGETGLFCEVNNPQSIAQKVEKLIKDRESRDYMVKNAKKMVEEKYGWEGIAREMKGLMVEV
jgi:glycosyltransferase involved in cell wall biosynthesis